MNHIYDLDGIILTLGGLLLLTPVIIVALRQRGKTQRAEAVLAREQEYRRLTEMALTTQELTDQRLLEISTQLADMRSRVESMERTLKEVE
ncbi:hypothetical protein GCM10010377_74360 [Streptomyces viridiviolaceus]|uniref:Uncharacterized protein n=1 Tax=Streptomyces viridiviolaceus TaxID=68282 RepID=A0ABW2E538_9ACTN|nr:hypothetical protein [Streptomyces viridiviolaceus]GHB72989.1 hypothetical protein GCM10010377_74360 [Streptomyces viridiviolaceus]